jgi:hypothetical protein
MGRVSLTASLIVIGLLWKIAPGNTLSEILGWKGAEGVVVGNGEPATGFHNRPLRAALVTRNTMTNGAAHFMRALSPLMTLLGHSRSISSQSESRREKVPNRPWLVSRATPLF